MYGKWPKYNTLFRLIVTCIGLSVFFAAVLVSQLDPWAGLLHNIQRRLHQTRSHHSIVDTHLKHPCLIHLVVQCKVYPLPSPPTRVMLLSSWDLSKKAKVWMDPVINYRRTQCHHCVVEGIFLTWYSWTRISKSISYPCIPNPFIASKCAWWYAWKSILLIDF